MFIVFLDLYFEVGEGCYFGDVIDEDYCVYIAVVVFDYVFAEAFLICCVLYLNLEDIKIYIWG